MDADISGFLLALGYNILIFIVSFAAWLYLRTVRGDPTVATRRQQTATQQQPYDLCSKWIHGAVTLFWPSSPTCFVPTDPALYLRFLQISTNLFVCLSIVGLFVVLPLNLSCLPLPGKEVQSFFDRAAAENAPSSIPVLWALYGASLVYSGLGYFFIYTFWNQAIKTVAASPHPPTTTPATTTTATTSALVVVSPHRPGADNSHHHRQSSSFRFHPHRLKPESYTLMVTGIPTLMVTGSPPRDIPHGYVLSSSHDPTATQPPPTHSNTDLTTSASLVDSSDLRQHFDRLRPGQVVHAHIVLNYSHLIKERNKLRAAERSAIVARRASRARSHQLVGPAGANSTTMAQPLLDEQLGGGEDMKHVCVVEEKVLLCGSNNNISTDGSGGGGSCDLYEEDNKAGDNNITPIDAVSICCSAGTTNTAAHQLMQQRPSLVDQEDDHCPLPLSTTPPPRSAWNLIFGSSSSGIATRRDSETERHFVRKYERQSTVTATALGKLQHQSVGIAFVSFNNKLAVDECLSDPRAVGDNYDWSLHPAPTPSDIVWANIHISKRQRIARAVILNIILMLVSVIVVSPVAIWNQLVPIADKLDEALKDTSYIRLTLAAWVAPLVLVMINSLLLPTLVYSVARGTRFWLHSTETNYVLHANIVYLILNILIIPLLSLQSIAAAIRQMYHTDVPQWSLSMGRILLSTSGSFAIHYLLNCCFLSSASQLLQLPQLSLAGINRGFYGTSTSNDSCNSTSQSITASSSNMRNVNTSSSSGTTTTANGDTATRTCTVSGGSSGATTTTTTLATPTTITGDASMSGSTTSSIGNASSTAGTTTASSNISHAISTATTNEHTNSSVRHHTATSSSDWHFDFGYWYAVCLSTFTLVFVFSVVVPLILPLGALFFALKYRIDRYNFENGVWCVDKDSGGRIVGTACRYMIFAISFLQFCMSGFFIIQQDRYLVLAGILLFVTSTMTVVLLLIHGASIFHTSATKLTTTKILKGRARREESGDRRRWRKHPGGVDGIGSDERIGIDEKDEMEEEEELFLEPEEVEIIRKAYMHPCERPHLTSGH
eukprot:GHVS01003978.1.p1 GENE.GHVS01003978.1~~GHVS01003978.1.p1  ORF type:complete len:1059 (+),score=183.26 GHVS01003978.1:93-3269(+)